MEPFNRSLLGRKNSTENNVHHVISLTTRGEGDVLELGTSEPRFKTTLLSLKENLNLAKAHTVKFPVMLQVTCGFLSVIQHQFRNSLLILSDFQKKQVSNYK